MFTSLIGATILLSTFTAALPRPRDSALGAEVGVSAVDGVVKTDSVELASQSSAEAAANTAGSAAAYATQASSWDSSSSYGSSKDSSSSDSSKDSSSYDSSKDSSSYDSSKDSSSYGSSMDSSSYGSSNSGSGYDSNMGNSYDTTTAAAWTTTTAAAQSYSTPSYGSGSDNWNSGGYDDCVQQCLASYGGAMGSATYAPTATSGGGSGSGATHVVTVAPSQGVLRYVPFALNASVGDTILFMWGANNHTVTKSSALTPCNKTSDALFTSGSHDKDFTFTQVVNSTDPTFFYCATPGHCAKGMFGIINPPNTLQGATSVGSMMQSVAANNSDVKAYAAYTTTQTAGSSAANWGTNIDIGSMPEWAHASVMENVLYTRNLLAANPDIMKDDGSVDLSGIGSTPLMVPLDVSAALQNAAAADGASGSSGSAAATSTAASAAAATSTGTANSQSTGNGAGSLAASKMLVGVVAVVATVFLL
ncbi:hypothetical protein BDZ89DRAFT_288217 [Hymenopellis radicata]|nr:hypothetical protein BDZ89DRAFT_288217 [Hymenopellis radicata]